MVKENDDLMAATRYAIMMLRHARNLKPTRLLRFLPRPSLTGGRSWMSTLTGLGPIQKRIRRAFIANPDQELYTADLVPLCYPRHEGKPHRHHRRAIVRAAEAVAERVGRDWPGGVIFRAKP